MLTFNTTNIKLLYNGQKVDGYFNNNKVLTNNTITIVRLTFNTDSPTIPTLGKWRSSLSTYITYNIDISVDNKNSWTHYTGSGTYFNISLPDKIVYMKCHGDEYNGWLKFFAYGNGNSQNLGSVAVQLESFEFESLNNNINPFIDYSILDGTSYYMEYVFHTCSNLLYVSNIPPINVLLNNFSYYLYNLFLSCTKLETIPNIPKLPDGSMVATLDSYLRLMCDKCTSLIVLPAIPKLPDSITSLNYYLLYTFQSCSNLQTALYIPVLGLENCEDMSYYMYFTYNNCNSLITLYNIPSIPNKVLILNYYLSYTFQNCKSLYSSPNIPKLPNSVTSCNTYLRNLFNGCSMLMSNQYVPAIPSFVSSISSYLSSTFQGCSLLTYIQIEKYNTNSVSRLSTSGLPTISNNVLNVDVYQKSLQPNISTVNTKAILNYISN